MIFNEEICIDSQVAILVYEITNKESFVSLKKWVNELKENGPKDLCIVFLKGKWNKMCLVLAVVGNKVDLVDQEKVTIEEASVFAKV